MALVCAYGFRLDIATEERQRLAASGEKLTCPRCGKSRKLRPLNDSTSAASSPTPTTTKTEGFQRLNETEVNQREARAATPRYVVAAVGGLIAVQGFMFAIIESSLLATTMIIVGSLLVAGGLHVELWAIATLPFRNALRAFRNLRFYFGRVRERWAKEADERERQFQRAVAVVTKKEVQEVAAQAEKRAREQQMAVAAARTKEAQEVAAQSKQPTADVSTGTPHASELFQDITLSRRSSEGLPEAPQESRSVAIFLVVIVVVAAAGFLVFLHDKERVAQREANRQTAVQAEPANPLSQALVERPTASAYRIDHVTDRRGDGAFRGEILREIFVIYPNPRSEEVLRKAATDVYENALKTNRDPLGRLDVLIYETNTEVRDFESGSYVPYLARCRDAGTVAPGAQKIVDVVFRKQGDRPTQAELELVRSFNKDYESFKAPLRDQALTGAQLEIFEKTAKEFREKLVKAYAMQFGLSELQVRRTIAKVWLYRAGKATTDANLDWWYSHTY